MKQIKEFNSSWEIGKNMHSKEAEHLHCKNSRVWHESSLEMRLAGRAWAWLENCQILVFEGDTVDNRGMKIFEQDSEVIWFVFKKNNQSSILQTGESEIEDGWLGWETGPVVPVREACLKRENENTSEMERKGGGRKGT